MLYIQTVEPITLGLLNRLMEDAYLQQFNLVGGTALSLQIGHRKSVDLEMFTQSDFEAAELLAYLNDSGYNPDVKHQYKQTLIVEIDGIKVDFIRFKYAFAQPIRVIDDIRLTQLEDIACMKIDAIAGRGKKKDFCDLYFLLKKFSLKEMMTWYQQMFQHTTIFHVYKSLTWFEDADLDADLVVFDPKFNWKEAKKSILTAVQQSL